MWLSDLRNDFRGFCIRHPARTYTQNNREITVQGCQLGVHLYNAFKKGEDAMTTFEPIWASLLTDLKAGTIVGNWTVLKGYLGDKMMIVYLQKDCIGVDAPGAKTTQIVQKSGFERVWQVWPDYKA